jgi:hypothetical protein
MSCPHGDLTPRLAGGALQGVRVIAARFLIIAPQADVAWAEASRHPDTMEEKKTWLGYGPLVTIWLYNMWEYITIYNHSYKEYNYITIYGI